MVSPQDAGTNLYEQSNAAYRRNDKTAGRRLLNAAFDVNRDLPGPWYQLAVVLAEEQRHEAAVACLRRAVELMPDSHHVLTNLSWELYKTGRYEEAYEAVVKAVAADPKAPLGWTDKALIEIALRRSGVESASTALALDPSELQAQMAYAFAMAFEGQLYTALLAYESRIPGRMPEFQSYPIPRWDGSNIKKLFVAAEQGLGDTIQFARYLHEATAYAEEVVLCVQKELIALFEDAFREWPEISFTPMPAAIPLDAQAYIPIMSLPVVLADLNENIEDENQANVYIGRLVRDDYMRRLYSELNVKHTGRYRIGIVWAGSPDQEENHNRSANPTDFLRLYDVPGVELVSLQFGKRKYDLEPLHPLILDGTQGIVDMKDTAKVLRGLNAVVTVCTSVAHLALALGVETYVVLPRHGQHWVWGHVQQCDWYRGVRLFRQERPGSWAEPMAGVAQALRLRFPEEPKSNTDEGEPTFVRVEAEE